MSEKTGAKKAGWIVAIIVVILAILVGAAYFFFRQKTPSTAQTGEVAAPTVNEKVADLGDLGRSKTARFLGQNQYSFTYSLESPTEAGSAMEINIVKRGEDVFTRAVGFGMDSLVLGDDFYQINHDSKVIHHRLATVADKPSFTDSTYQEDETITLTTGQETIGGLTYDTEKFGDDSTFYFIGDELKMFKEDTTGLTMLVKNFSHTIDESVFTLPADYQMQELTTESVDNAGGADSLTTNTGATAQPSAAEVEALAKQYGVDLSNVDLSGL